MTNVRAPIFVRLGERGWGQTVPTAGTLTKITIADLVATGAEWTSSITGRARRRRLGHRPERHPDLGQGRRRRRAGDAPGAGEGARVSRRCALPQSPRVRPVLPARAGLRVERTTLGVATADARPALVLDDVRGATVKDLMATAPGGRRTGRLATLLPRLPARRHPGRGRRDAGAHQRRRDGEGRGRRRRRPGPAGRARRSRREPLRAPHSGKRDREELEGGAPRRRRRPATPQQRPGRLRATSCSRAGPASEADHRTFPSGVAPPERIHASTSASGADSMISPYWGRLIRPTA